MAVVKYDIKVVVQSTAPVERLSDEEKDLLYEKPDFHPGKRLRLRDNDVLPDDSHETVLEPEVKISNILEGYQEVAKETNRLLEAVQTRSKDLVLYIDPSNDPELYDCVNRLFQADEPIVKVTYDMYLEALRYIKDIGLELAKEV